MLTCLSTMIPATPRQSVLVQLFNFLFNGRMLNREKQIKIFLLNISFHARGMRGLNHNTHMHEAKYKVLDETCQIVRIQSYKYGNHKYKLLYIKLENLEVSIVNCHP